MSVNRLDQDVHVLALVKGNGERYVFLYGDNQKTETFRQFGRFAANEDLSFTWWDAAVLSKRIRESEKHNTAVWSGGQTGLMSRFFRFDS